jgi:hypothetical protein
VSDTGGRACYGWRRNINADARRGYSEIIDFACACIRELDERLSVATAALRDVAKGLHMIESREVAQKALDIIDGK